ncbi:MAG TPA: hypothetical protein VIH17_03270 [Candidatus Acidoferrales bacterium]
MNLNMIAFHDKTFFPGDEPQGAGVQTDLDIGQPPTTATDEVVVAARSPIVADGLISEFDFADGTVPAEPVERVINGCVGNPRMLFLNTRKNLRGGRMVVAGSNHFQDGPAMPGETRLRLHLE